MQAIAATARLVTDHADAGDPYCRELVRRAAHLAAEIACSIYVRLAFASECSVDVVMAGGLFQCPTYRGFFTEELRHMTRGENLCFLEAVSSPVMGGIALAKVLFA